MPKATSLFRTLNPSRRSLLASCPLAVIAAAIPNATLGLPTEKRGSALVDTPAADSELLAKITRFNFIEDHTLSFYPGGANRILDDNAREKALKPSLEEQCALLSQISSLRATTAAGIAARAAMLAKWAPDRMEPPDPRDWEATMLSALLRDAIEMLA